MATINCDKNDTAISIQKHDCYEEMIPRWSVISDTIQDEYQIKSKGSEYLPIPSGIQAEPDEKLKNAQYNSYKTRAVYYQKLSSTIGGMMGLVTRKPPEITLNDRIDSMQTSSGFDGDSINVVMNRTLENQLSYSRYGILLDIRKGSSGSDVVPFMSEYLGDKIVNWEFDVINGEKKLVALVLDESFYKIDAGFVRTYEEQYRICALDYVDKETPVYYTYIATPTEVGKFVMGQGVPEDATIPSIAGNTLSFIPFQPFNALSLEMKTEIPLLMELANLSLAIYRGEADYRSSLYMQGQATPYLTGSRANDETVGLGANTFVEISDEKAKLGFLEVSGNGIDAQKEGLDGLHNRCSEIGISLVNGNSQESGEALSIRVGVKTASLAGVAKTNAKGFQNLFKWSAEWTGSNPDEITIVQNTDFSDGRPDMKEIVEFANMVEKNTARLEDLFNLMKRFELTNSPDFESWKDDLDSSDRTLTSFVIGNEE